MTREGEEIKANKGKKKIEGKGGCHYPNKLKAKSDRWTRRQAGGHTRPQTGRRPSLGPYIRLSFKNIWLVITRCCLTLQQLNALMPAAAYTHTHTQRELYTHKKSLDLLSKSFC